MQSLVGQDVGRYHIVEQLGEGGMATVYKAYDNRLERNVAIKVIRSDQAQDAAFHRRFEREAKSLAQLSHTHIVKVLDYGEYEGVPYVVMEYLPGGTLKEKMGRPMDYRQAAKILAPIARALEYAHTHKIIHRDVKPANILLGESGQPMLSDFGIAKILEAEGMTQLTSTGVGIGTPEYMAPEQGFGRAIDQRADVYALGVVFYELVTGRRPFHADTPLAVLMKHMTDPLPPPKSFVADLPDAVEKVIFKAMTKKPEHRFQDMGVFAAALELLAQGRVAQVDEDAIAAVVVEEAAAPATGQKKWILPVGIAGGVVLVGLVCLGLAALGVFSFGRDLFGIGKDTPQPETTALSQLETPGATSLPGGADISGRQRARWGNGVVTQAAFTPDGQSIVAATTLGLDVLDAATLELDQGFAAGTYMDSLALSPDGDLAAALASSGSLQLWDLQAGELVRTLEGYPGLAGNLAFSPDGKWLACASSEGLIRLWQTSDWSVARQLDMQLTGQSMYPMVYIEFSPDSALLVAASGGAALRAFDVNSGSQVWSQQAQAIGGQAFLTGMDVSPDGSWVAAAVTNQPLVWSLVDGQPVDLSMQAMALTSNIAFSPDGKTLALAGYQTGFVFLESGTWKASGSLDAQPGMNEAFLFSPDGSRILLPGGYARAEMQLWQLPAGSLLASSDRYTSMASGLAALIDGKLISAVYNDSSARVFQLSDGSILASTGGGTVYGGQSFIFISSDEARLLLASGREVRTLQVSDGSALGSFEIDTSSYSAAVSPGWEHLALGTYQGGVQAYRLSDGTLLGTMQGHTQRVSALAFSPDGSLLASASQDGAVRLWQAGGWTELRALQGHSAGVNGLAFSPDGSLLASASDDNTVILWRVMDGAPMLTLSGHADAVRCVAFSPDGARLASGSADSTIRIWDAGKGTMLLTLEGHTSSVAGLAFIEGGEAVASVSWDGTVRIWDTGR